jgi:hypothetical protein
LAQQDRSREWAAAPSAATHIPPSPAPGNSWHGSDAGFNTTPQTLGRPRTRPTHAHGWAGGCCVVGAPTRSPLGPPRRGPEPARRGGYRRPFRAPSSPRYRARPIAAPKRGSSPGHCRNLPPDSLHLLQAGRDDSGRALPPRPPWDLTPLDSRRTGRTAERDPRHAKGRDARAAPHAALRAPYQAFTQHTLG